MSDLIPLAQGPRLVRAEDVYGGRRARAASAPPAEWAFQTYPPVFVDRPQPDLSRRGELAQGVEAAAEVNFGRWVARCPFCPSAQVVTPQDPRFLCAGSDGCANAPVRGAFVRVVFPAPQVQTAVEGTLLVRPRENQNWHRNEKVSDLRKENAAHGLD